MSTGENVGDIQNYLYLFVSYGILQGLLLYSRILKTSMNSSFVTSLLLKFVFLLSHKIGYSFIPP